MKNQWIIRITIIVLVSIAMIAYLRYASTSGSSVSPTRTDLIREDPYEGDFALMGTPIQGQPVTLIFSIKPQEDLPDTRLNILLPSQIQLIEGNGSWQGDAKAGVWIELKVVVKALEIGEWEIRAVVKNPRGPAFERVYFAYIVSGEDHGELRALPAVKEYPTQPPNISLEPTPN